MIDVDGWVNWATELPGPAHKVYPTVNGGYGIVWHSAEGWLTGSLRELEKPERQASWMFSIDIDGTLYQHYPVTASCWASGNGLANTQWWSVELMGTRGMPINDAQLQTAKNLITGWALHTGRFPTREGNMWTKTMWEHREVDTIATPNAGQTACPSERYARLWAELEGDLTNTDRIAALEEQVQRLERLVAGNGYRLENGEMATGEEAMKAAAKDGSSLFLGLGLTQKAMALLSAASEGGLVPHVHKMAFSPADKWQTGQPIPVEGQ